MPLLFAPRGSSTALDESLSRWVESRRKLWIFCAFIAATIWTILFFQFTIDDAFISFRYGQMLVEHHVWNWNPSGDRVEAYTSLTYTALSIIPAFLHMSSALFFKIFGILCVGGMIHRLHARSSSGFAFLLALSLIALHPWLWMHTFSGLETPLYMLLILEMAICVERADSVNPLYVYTIFLLLPLTRPEGLVFALAGVALFLKRRGNLPLRLGQFMIVMSFGLVLFVTSWHYFHAPFPNPFYVKVTHSSLREIRASLLANIASNAGMLAALGIAFGMARKLSTRVFIVCGIALMLFLFAPHMMPMNYAHRFYFQLFLPLILIFYMTEDLLPIARMSCVIAVVSLITVAIHSDLRMGLEYFPYLSRAHVDLGTKLAPFARNHTLLIGDAGAVPYYSGWVSYDFMGLCTNKIAKDGLTVNGLQEMQPDLIVIYTHHPGPTMLQDPETRTFLTAQAVVVDYMIESGEYQYAGASRFRYFYLAEFVRKNTSDLPEILSAIEQNTNSSAPGGYSMENLLLQKYVPWRR